MMIVLAILALELMILVHEVGHLIVAKRVGIAVHTFALGFGPRLFGWTWGETTYNLNLLPLGGYVNMAGEDDDNTPTDVPPDRRFRAKSVGQRLAVVCAGPIMNFLLAIVLLGAFGIAYGVPVGPSTRIGTLLPGYPAAQAGLRPGDVIVAIDGRPMHDGKMIIETVHHSNGRTLGFLIQRGSQRFLVHVPTRYDSTQRVWLTGFTPLWTRKHFDPLRAMGWGVVATGQNIAAILTALGGVFGHGKQLWEGMGGPVAAVRVLGQAANAGGEWFLQVMASFSIMLGLFNLFPVPALDGGRAAFLVVEGLRGRPVDPKREGYIHLVGLGLLLTLILALTVRDILHPIHITLP